MEGDAKARIAAVANATVAFLKLLLVYVNKLTTRIVGHNQSKNRAALCTLNVFKGLYRGPIRGR